MAVADGVIIAAGSTAEVLDEISASAGTTTIDARGTVVVPGFVDPHTHLVFAGSRADEFEMRLAGATYQE
ncbi:MAG: amidohydrolase family protein, partial [Planctomycetaceae bacterium]